MSGVMKMPERPISRFCCTLLEPFLRHPTLHAPWARN
jgi:hypothetical protein